MTSNLATDAPEASAPYGRTSHWSPVISTLERMKTHVAGLVVACLSVGAFAAQSLPENARDFRLLVEREVPVGSEAQWARIRIEASLLLEAGKVEAISSNVNLVGP
jgi:hypothetical protein